MKRLLQLSLAIAIAIGLIGSSTIDLRTGHRQFDLAGKNAAATASMIGEFLEESESHSLFQALPIDSLSTGTGAAQHANPTAELRTRTSGLRQQNDLYSRKLVFLI